MSADPKPGSLLLVAVLLATNLLDCQAAIRGRVHQKDGTVHHGRLVEINSAGKLVFTSPAATTELNDSAKAIILQPGSNTNSPTRPEHRVELRDRSTISGRLLSLDENHLRIAPTYSDPIAIDRDAVTAIRWTDLASGVSYEGQYTTNRWTISQITDRDEPGKTLGPSWKLEDGIFVSQGKGSLACEANLPTVARVEFDLHWQQRPRFRLAFFARDTEHYSFTEGYRFYSPGHGTLYAMTRSTGPNQAVELSRVPVPAFVHSNFVHLDFRLNSQTGDGWLFADGKEIRHWTDLGYSGSGTAVMFYNFKGETRLGVSNLRVSKWDGRTANPPARSTRRHVIVFKNGDTTETEKLSVTDTHLTFRFNGGPLTIDANRVAQVFMPSGLPVTGRDSTWIQFLHGDWIRARIIGVEADTITWQHRQASSEHQTPITRIRGLHFSQKKPVMDLSWYLPTMPASEARP